MQRTSIRITKSVSKKLHELTAPERRRLSAIYRIAKGEEPYTHVELTVIDTSKLVRAFTRRSFTTLAGILEYLTEIELDALVYSTPERQRPNEL